MNRRLVASCSRSWGSPRFAETRHHRPRYRATRRWSDARDGVGRASLPATPRPFEEFPPQSAVPCHHGLSPLAVGAPSGGRPPRSPLPVGGSSAVRQNPSTSRSCSACGSVASDTLSGARIARSFHGLAPPPRSDFLRFRPGFPGRPGDPKASERPALATVANHRAGAVDIPPKRFGRSRRGSLSGGVVRRIRRRDRPPWGSRR